MKPNRDFIALLAVVAGCSRKDPTQAATGAQDSALEAAVDAPTIDSPVAIAWNVPPLAPKECQVRISSAPKADPGPLKWRACSDVKNCTQSIMDWTEGGGSTLTVRLYEPVKLVNGKPLLAYTRRLTRKGSIEIDGYVEVIEELGGEPKFALRQLRTDDTWCGAWTAVGDWGVVTWFSVAGGKGVFIGSLPTGSSAPSAMRFGFLSNEQLLVLPPEGGPQFASVGTANYFLETVSPSSIAIIDPSVLTVRSRPTPLPAAVGPRSYHDGALAYAADGSGGWGFLSSSGEFTRWRSSSGRETTALSIDRQSLGAIAWIESVSSSGAFSEPTLYISPPAKTAADVVATKIAALRDDLESGAAGMVANDGLALTIASHATAVVIDLKTGARSELTAPSDSAFVLPLWISAGEAWLLAGRAGVPNPQLSTNTILRMRF